MFLYVWLRGFIYKLFWRFGVMISGTAPSFYTAWCAYGIFGECHSPRCPKRFKIHRHR